MINVSSSAHQEKCVCVRVLVCVCVCGIGMRLWLQLQSGVDPKNSAGVHTAELLYELKDMEKSRAHMKY